MGLEFLYDTRIGSVLVSYRGMVLYALRGSSQVIAPRVELLSLMPQAGHITACIITTANAPCGYSWVRLARYSLKILYVSLSRG
jgi:hypothetical protein